MIEDGEHVSTVEPTVPIFKARGPGAEGVAFRVNQSHRERKRNTCRIRVEVMDVDA